MGIDQKFLNNTLFMTLCVCLLLLFSNMYGLHKASFVEPFINQSKEKTTELSLWEEKSAGVYVLEPFSVEGYFSLKQYLNKVVDKRIIVFEVLSGRARVVLGQV